MKEESVSTAQRRGPETADTLPLDRAVLLAEYLHISEILKHKCLHCEFMECEINLTSKCTNPQSQ